MSTQGDGPQTVSVELTATDAYVIGGLLEASVARMRRPAVRGDALADAYVRAMLRAEGVPEGQLDRRVSETRAEYLVLHLASRLGL